MYTASKSGLGAFVASMRRKVPSISFTSIYTGRVCETTLSLSSKATGKEVNVNPRVRGLSSPIYRRMTHSLVQLIAAVMDAIVTRKEMCAMALRQSSGAVKGVEVSPSQPPWPR